MPAIVRGVVCGGESGVGILDHLQRVVGSTGRLERRGEPEIGFGDERSLGRSMRLVRGGNGMRGEEAEGRAAWSSLLVLRSQSRSIGMVGLTGCASVHDKLQAASNREGLARR